MSKSKGEFLTVSLLKSKGYDPLAYRFFCLQSHYRKGLVFSYENLDNAAVAYKKLIARIASLAKDAKETSVDAEKLAQIKKPFADAMDNDLNTSLAVTALYDVLKADANAATKLQAIADMDNVLQLNLIAQAEAMAQPVKEETGLDEETTAWVEQRIAARAAAKKAKNYAEADAIRAEILAAGIEITDTKDGVKYKKI